MDQLKALEKEHSKEETPKLRAGDVVAVHQEIEEGDKKRIQVFEGIVIARKNGKGITGTITVRKDVKGIGVEKTFPIHSPLIEKIEVLQKHKTRKSKLYYLRNTKGRKTKKLEPR